MRLRKVKNAKLIIAKYPNILIQEPKNCCGKWSTIFGNDNPIYLEIGMGKGKFLIEHAIRNPHINYIGIEKFDSVIIRAVEKLSELNLPNILLLNEDASELREFFSEGEISKIFLNFSDPWPKSRHAKRRLTHSSFLELYEQILQPKSFIELKTDNQKLFCYSLQEMNNYSMYFEELSFDLHEVDNDDIITTEYEDKFKSLKQNIYYLKAKF